MERAPHHGRRVDDEVAALFDDDPDFVYPHGAEQVELVQIDDVWYRVDEVPGDDDAYQLQALDTRIVEFSAGRQVQVVELGGEDDPWVLDDRRIQRAHDWLAERDDDWHLYIEPRDANAEFWASPPVLYHGTTRQKLAGIIDGGLLEARNETRGLSNRSTGAAVFAHANRDYVEYHYAGEGEDGVVLEIDCAAMKAAGCTPEISGEQPLDDAEMVGALAHAIGVEDYDAAESFSSDGLDPETLIIHGDVPAAFLRLDGRPLEHTSSRPQLGDVDAVAGPGQSPPPSGYLRLN